MAGCRRCSCRRRLRAGAAACGKCGARTDRPGNAVDWLDGRASVSRSRREPRFDSRDTLEKPPILERPLECLDPHRSVESQIAGARRSFRPTLVAATSNLSKLDKPRSNTRSSKLQRWPQFVHICASCDLGSGTHKTAETSEVSARGWLVILSFLLLQVRRDFWAALL